MIKRMVLPETLWVGVQNLWMIASAILKIIALQFPPPCHKKQWLGQDDKLIGYRTGGVGLEDGMLWCHFATPPWLP
ncbi:hypothetical protein BH23BAC3_BH23BAC3_13540 [soil metagenome]